jgi:outer membrane protein assembly factor BamD (BamD/ComL family)
MTRSDTKFLRPTAPLVLLVLAALASAGAPAAAWQSADHEADREAAERELESAESALAAAERAYELGLHALDRNRYREATEAFQRAIEMQGSRADGAAYWKAYSLYKQSEFQAALAELQELRASHPTSRWLKQARELELEMRGGGDPESANGDADVKLLAIAGLLRRDPDRAMPHIERFLAGDYGSEHKMQALFLLVQTGRPDALDRLEQVATDDSDPELQMEALQHLGMLEPERALPILQRIYDETDAVEVKMMALHGLMVAGDKERILAAARGESSEHLQEQAIHMLGNLGAVDELARLYETESAPSIRAAILDGFMMAGDRERILRAAREESSEELRRHAIHMLGALGGGDELWQMFRSESSIEIKTAILESLAMTGEGERLAEIARSKEAPEIREAAIHGLAMSRAPERTSLFRSLYADETDHRVRMALVHAMAMQQDVDGLIEVARNEKDRELRTEIVSWLSEIDSPKATEFLIEVLDED